MMSESKAIEQATSAGLEVLIVWNTRGLKKIKVGKIFCEWKKDFGGNSTWRVEGSDRRGMFKGEAIAHAVELQKN